MRLELAFQNFYSFCDVFKNVVIAERFSLSQTCPAVMDWIFSVLLSWNWPPLYDLLWDGSIFSKITQPYKITACQYECTYLQIIGIIRTRSSVRSEWLQCKNSRHLFKHSRLPCRSSLANSSISSLKDLVKSMILLASPCSSHWWHFQISISSSSCNKYPWL